MKTYYAKERAAQAAVLRDVAGNPFRTLPARWFPAHVVGLARACYDIFPGIGAEYLVLADALDDMGEADAAGHCREATHVRGCAVLDWILGRR
jgi:hypothetical protein